MAVNIIIRGLFAIFGIGAVMFTMMPTIYQVAYNLDIWNNMPTDLLMIRDNLYSVFLAMGIISLGVAILWMFSAATRKEDVSAYD